MFSGATPTRAAAAASDDIAGLPVPGVIHSVTGVGVGGGLGGVGAYATPTDTVATPDGVSYTRVLVCGTWPGNLWVTSNWPSVGVRVRVAPSGSVIDRKSTRLNSSHLGIS